MTSFDGKSVLITGGAGGIGAAAGAEFARAGAHVVLMDRDALALDEVAGHIGGAVRPLVGDVAEPADMAAAVSASRERTGRLDVAVLNAGACGVVQPVDQYPDEVFDTLLRVNVRGVFCGLQAALPPMLERKDGSIIIVSSISGVMGFTGVSAYTVTKHAVIGMMRAAAGEAAPHNVRVNAIAPGFVQTQMIDELAAAASPDDPEALHDAARERTPLKRYAHPQEIAKLMAFLGGEGGSYCTGGVYAVDGGYST